MHEYAVMCPSLKWH